MTIINQVSQYQNIRKVSLAFFILSLELKVLLDILKLSTAKNNPLFQAYSE
jgi:hypothetical protein